MWVNAELKKDAKFHLRGSYGIALLTAFIFVVVSYVVNGIVNTIFAGGLGQLASYITDLVQNRVDPSGNLEIYPEDIETLRLIVAEILRTSLIVTAVTWIIQQVLHNPLNISIQNWYVRNRETQMAPPVGLVFSHLSGNYINLVLGSLWKNFWLMLWNIPSILLLILMLLEFDLLGFSVPAIDALTQPQTIILFGILFLVNLVFSIFLINRTIAYAMQDFLLADNPSMGARRSLNLSKKMMTGNKWHYIGLSLSFIGWYLLAGLLPILGPILLTPYVSQTMAELYGTLRSQAVARGDITMEELGFISNDAYSGDDGFNPYNDQYQFHGNQVDPRGFGGFDPNSQQDPRGFGGFDADKQQDQRSFGNDRYDGRNNNSNNQASRYETDFRENVDSPSADSPDLDSDRDDEDQQ